MIGSCRWCGGHGVEVSIAIAMNNDGPGLQILYRKSKSVKLNGIVIVVSKLPNT